MTIHRSTGAAAALAVIFFGLASGRAEAASLSRAWVSGHGVDQAGCGAPASPCRTFQYTHDNIVASGGEIDVLDPAGYGPITITKALSIVNDGVGVAGVQQGTSGADAIVVNAGASDAVSLRGLSVEGLNNGQNGLTFNSGAALTIANCAFRRFSNDGIFINASGAMTFSIADTSIDGDSYGVDIEGTAAVTGIINRTATNNNAFGVIQVGNDAAAVTIVDSVSANNLTAGYSFVTGKATLTRATASGNEIGIRVITTKAVFVADSNASNNSVYGLYNSGTAVLTRFVATGNGTGVFTGSGASFTYGDNRIFENGANISGALTTTSGN